MNLAEAIAVEYAAYREGRRSREPQLTASEVAWLIEPGLREEDARLPRRKALLARVRSQLERDRKAGRIASSLGERKGREVRMYEPSRLMSTPIIECDAGSWHSCEECDWAADHGGEGHCERTGHRVRSERWKYYEQTSTPYEPAEA